MTARVSISRPSKAVEGTTLSSPSARHRGRAMPSGQPRDRCDWLDSHPVNTRILVSVAILGAAASLSAAPPTGSITRHVWTGVGGTSVDALTGLADFPDNPDISDTLSSFRAPVDWANDYGTRVRGWVQAPVTGDYTFSIHSDDNSELWLSTTSSPDDRRLVASVPEWTNDGQWDKFTSQSSDPVPLEAGHYYFIEALQKEGTGGDNLGVAWSYPGQARSYIPGSNLSPWQNLPPEPQDDSAHLPPGGRSRSRCSPTTATRTAPATSTPPPCARQPGHRRRRQFRSDHGLATYIHTGTGTGTDSFDYQIRDGAGLPATATVRPHHQFGRPTPSRHIHDARRSPAATVVVTNAFPGLCFSQPLGITSPPGETNRLSSSSRKVETSN